MNAASRARSEIASNVKVSLKEYRNALCWMARDLQAAVERINALNPTIDSDTDEVDLNDQNLVNNILGTIAAGRQAVRSSLTNDVCDLAKEIQTNLATSKMLHAMAAREASVI